MESMESRTCLHCVLERAVGHASPALEAAGLSVTLHAREPIWLPETPVKIEVLDRVAGKSHIEVTATFRAGRRWRVQSISVPRYLPRALWFGFAEGIASELRVEGSGRRLREPSMRATAMLGFLALALPAQAESAWQIDPAHSSPPPRSREAAGRHDDSTTGGSDACDQRFFQQPQGARG